MKHYTDKELAGRLLAKRCHNSRESLGYFASRNRLRMMLSLALLVILFAAGVFVQSMLFCGFLIGLAFGVFFRDRAWRDAQTAAWSFYSQVIDWPKVKQLAKGEPAARLDPVATG